MQITSYAMNYYNTPAQSNNKANDVENNADNSVSSGDKTANAENNTQNNDKNAGQKNIGEPPFRSRCFFLSVPTTMRFVQKLRLKLNEKAGKRFMQNFVRSTHLRVRNLNPVTSNGLFVRWKFIS